MTLDDLSRVLHQFGVDPSSIAVGGPPQEGRYCLTQEAGAWHAFFLERGTRVDEKVFATDWQATDAYIIQVAADPLTRRGASTFRANT